MNNILLRVPKFLLLTILISFILIFIIQSCHSPVSPPINKGNVSLSFYEAASTEAWIKFTADNVSLPVNLTIKSGNDVLYNSSVTSSDSLIYIDSLLPNKSYTLQGYFTENNRQSTTDKITFTTMDTTSNYFTWQTFTFGGNAGSCNLYDVAIVNDTLAYAVGSIYLNDSTGKPDPYPYSLGVWNGKSWSFKHIYYTDQNNNSLLISPLQGINFISLTNIWFSGGSIYQWDGVSTQLNISLDRYDYFNGGNEIITKLWGITSNNIYCVGTLGTIAHYDGKTWQKIESGSTADINDIWGIDVNGSVKVYCAVSDIAQLSEHKILTIDSGNKVDSVKWDVPGRRVGTIWTKTGFPIYVGGGGVFENKRGYWKEQKEIPLYYSTKIRGNDLNDIYVCGSYGLFAHYNGERWKYFNNLYVNGSLLSLAVKGDMVIAVGYLDNEQAFIVLGKRN